MVEALKKELQMRKNYLIDPEIETLYFGGGTPSILENDQLAELIEEVKANYELSDQAEITLEANPDDLSKEKLEALSQLGVNRLSIGIQSFDDEILKYFNRAHDSQMAKESVRLARELGIKNISIDLIFGVPGQTLDKLAKDIQQALKLNTPHISIYGLTIEENTVFGRWEKQKKLQPIDEELARQHLILIMNQLQEAGYEQYEISNFSQAGFRSRHNSSYWADTHYLGIGPAAHSYDGISRQYNVPNNARYLKKITEGSAFFERELLTPEEKVTEMILTQLRKVEGLSIQALQELFQFDILRAKQTILQNLIDKRLVQIIDKHICLTQEGKLLCDAITEELLP